MSTYMFLSDDWLAEARRIREELRDTIGTVPEPMRMNLVVVKVPFGDGEVLAHLQATDEGIELDLEHLDPADLHVTAEYETVKAILIEGNTQAAISAFMSGRIRIDGDLTRLLSAIQGKPAAGADELAARLRAITA